MQKLYKPFVSIDLGEFLADGEELEGWSLHDLEMIGGSEGELAEQLLANRLPITMELALILSNTFGQSPEYWISLDTGFRLMARHEA
ncbi:MAG: helix-turn-helix transcriptional regulator [Candidatus Geothermincolia bacterium]